MAVERYRCDYCSELVPLGVGRIFWTEIDELDDGETVLFLPSVYCCDHCGAMATQRAGTGRG